MQQKNHTRINDSIYKTQTLVIRRCVNKDDIYLSLTSPHNSNFTAESAETIYKDPQMNMIFNDIRYTIDAINLTALQQPFQTEIYNHNKLYPRLFQFQKC